MRREKMMVSHLFLVNGGPGFGCFGSVTSVERCEYEDFESVCLARVSPGVSMKILKADGCCVVWFRAVCANVYVWYVVSA